MMLLMSGWYFVIFLSRVSAANLSLQHVTSMKCMVILGVGASDGGLIIQVSYDAQFFWFKPSVVVASLVIACAWQ